MESKYRVERVLFVLVVVGFCTAVLALPQIPNKPLIDPIPLEALGQMLSGVALMVMAIFVLKRRSNKRRGASEQTRTVEK